MDKWYTISPVCRYWDKSAHTVKHYQLSDKVYISSQPEWLEESETVERMPEEQRTQISESAYFIVTEYFASSLGELDPQSNKTHPSSLQETAAHKVLLVPLALWLIKPSGFSTSSIIHFGQEKNYPPVVRSIFAGATLLVSDSDIRNTLEVDDFSAAKPIYQSLISLNPGSTLYTAIRLLHKALAEGMWEVRYLLHWTVLESLFGSDAPGETTHKLCERIAYCLEDNPEGRVNIYKETKKAYAWRSKIVHGSKLTKLTSDESEMLMRRIEAYIRKCLILILSDVEKTKVFNSEGRNVVLTSLIFGGGISTRALAR